MTVQSPGWYEDPQDSQRLRYWDGVIWTDHVVPRRPPTLDESHLGSAVDQRIDRSTPVIQHLHAGGWPAGVGRLRASDGTALAGWWRRVGAFFIDALLINMLVVVLAWPLVSGPLDALSQWWENAVAAAMTGAPPPTVPAGLVGQLAVLNVTIAAIQALYEVIGVSRWGATVGRLAAGIRVRSVSTGNRLSVAAAVRRTVIKFLGDLTSPAPVFGLLATLFSFVDRLWPLWDQHRQALHDKVVDSQVVLAPRRRNDLAAMG